MKRRETGILGEKIARDYLVKQGYAIVESNYRCREGEIDIIARRQDMLVFLEVRTKRSLSFGTPEESITPAKMEKLRMAAERYQQEHEDLPAEWRIDVVAVELDGRGNVRRISQIENAVG